MTYLHQSLLSAFIAIFPIMLLLSLLTFKKMKNNKKEKYQSSLTGMVRLSLKDISSFKINNLLYHLNEPGFPQRLNIFIARPTSGVLGVMLKEITSTQSSNNDDIRRAITIAAAMYLTPIPNALVLLDSRTKILLLLLKRELLELHNVTATDYKLHNTNSMESIKLSINHEIALRSKYNKGAIRIATAIIECATDGVYPSLICFVNIVNARVIDSDKLSLDEVSGIATAYARITGIKIPLAYINYDDFAFALIYPNAQTPVEVKAKLTLVK